MGPSKVGFVRADYFFDGGLGDVEAYGEEVLADIGAEGLVGVGEVECGCLGGGGVML